MTPWTEIADAAVLTVIREHRGKWSGPKLRTGYDRCPLGRCPLGLVSEHPAPWPWVFAREFQVPSDWASRIMAAADNLTSKDPTLRASMLQAAGLVEAS